MSDLTISLLSIAGFIVALMIPFFIWNYMKKNTIDKIVKKSNFIASKKYVSEYLLSSSIFINTNDEKIAIDKIKKI